MAAKPITTLGYLRGAEHIGTSVNGNPRYRLIVEDLAGYFTTYVSVSDAGFCYGITNPQYKNVVLEFTLTPAHRVKYVRIVETGEPI